MRYRIIISLIVALLLSVINPSVFSPFTPHIAQASDGTEDTTFYTNLGTGFDNKILAIVVQSDNKILVGGEFTDFNNTGHQYLVRLNSDGTEDTDFYNNFGGHGGFNSIVESIAVQSDNKILVGGDFTDLNGNTRERLIRLNSDGTEDTDFYTNLTPHSTGFDVDVTAITLQSDNKILVGGAFTDLSGSTRGHLVRLRPDGFEDTAFYTNLGTGYDDNVNSVVVQSDNKILVGGAFAHCNGNNRRRLSRLNSDGTEDAGFLGSGSLNSPVKALALQSDDKILVGGAFTTFGGARNRLLRMNSNGSENATFYTNLGTGFDDVVNAIALQSNEDILVGGDFLNFNSNSRNHLVRLTTADTTAPTVTNITSATANGTYAIGQAVSIQVVFDEAVIVTGTPQLTLETGASDAVVNYASGSGTTSLTFTYTVASGHVSSDLDYANTTALALSGGTIKDAALNAAVLTLPAAAAAGSLGANKAIVIDGVAPTLTTTTVDGITLVLTYDQALDASSTPATTDFVVTVDGVPRAVTDVDITASVVTLTITAVSAGQAVLVSYTAGGAPVQDSVGNNADNLVVQAVTNSTPDTGGSSSSGSQSNSDGNPSSPNNPTPTSSSVVFPNSVLVGQVIKFACGPTVYLVGLDGLHPFSTYKALLAYQAKFKYQLIHRQECSTVPYTILPSLADGMIDAMLPGTNFKYASSLAVYYLNRNSQSEAYPSLDVFRIWNGANGLITTIPTSQQYPSAGLIGLPNGTLVTVRGSATIWRIENNLARPISGWTVFVRDGYQLSAVHTIPLSYLHTFPAGAPIQ